MKNKFLKALFYYLDLVLFVLGIIIFAITVFSVSKFWGGIVLSISFIALGRLYEIAYENNHK